ncbi:methyltransferase [Methylobacterium sp. Leaf88]|uniref:methyltransferase n=1 Tax=Methylobacterium sp. Leaf88 TaxID=1736244 RepID=UPI0006FD094B|nr:methyltransferase [Methylobacterium sp. Leaf88]KQO74431.1 methyltransferase [Methylobacterium sp. Leaf88]
MARGATLDPPARAGAGGLRARWYALRARLVADPRFQRWAAGFPLTRRIAQARTRALFDLCAGFTYSQTLFACVRLDLFGMLSEGPVPEAALAHRMGLAPEAGTRLLKAAASLGLIRRLPDGHCLLADLGAALVGNPAIGRMIEHHALLYEDLRDPVALLRGEAGPTRLAGYWPYASGDGPDLQGDAVASYSGLMSASQALIAEDILKAYPMRRHRCLMDVGGGEGAFLAAAGRVAPDLQLRLFDLPAVADRAEERMMRAGLAGRFEAFGGSFRTDPLPPGADAITLVRVVHDHDDATVRILLAAVREALPPGGRLILAEPMSGTPGGEPITDAYFGLYLLAMGSGRCRSARELRALLSEAGFRRTVEVATRRPLLTRLLVSTR